MLSARISSYGCTWEVWRAREKRKSCLRRSREQLLLLQCSRNSIIAEWRIGNPLNGFLSFFFFFFFLIFFFVWGYFFFFFFSFFIFFATIFFFLEEHFLCFYSCFSVKKDKSTFVLQAEMPQIPLFPFSPTVRKPPIPACTSKQNVLNLKAHLPFGILAMS